MTDVLLQNVKVLGIDQDANEKRTYIRDCRPRGLSVAQGCRLMGLPRSTYYDVPKVAVDEAEI